MRRARTRASVRTRQVVTATDMTLKFLRTAADAMTPSVCAPARTSLPFMEHALRHSIVARQYRLATALVVIGAMSVGSLLLGRLSELYYGSIVFYYGLGDFYEPPIEAVGGLSLTIGQLCVAALALGGTVFFVAGERRRLRRVRAHERRCAGTSCLLGVERLSREQRLLTLLQRTVLFAGVLLVLWFAQTFYLDLVSGYGLPLIDVSVGVSAFMPLITVFFGCLLIGMLVAGVSMFGLRAIVQLRQAFTRVRARRRVKSVSLRAVHRVIPRLRDLHGIEVLTRPPPARCIPLPA